MKGKEGKGRKGRKRKEKKRKESERKEKKEKEKKGRERKEKKRKERQGKKTKARKEGNERTGKEQEGKGRERNKGNKIKERLSGFDHPYCFSVMLFKRAAIYKYKSCCVQSFCVDIFLLSSSSLSNILKRFSLTSLYVLDAFC